MSFVRPQMQLTEDQNNEAALLALGNEVIELLASGQIAALAARFGYALAFKREPSEAIHQDLALSLESVQASALLPLGKSSATKVKYFQENETGLCAVIECLAKTNNGAEILVELVMTSSGEYKHVTLEQISAVLA